MSDSDNNSAKIIALIIIILFNILPYIFSFLKKLLRGTAESPIPESKEELIEEESSSKVLFVSGFGNLIEETRKLISQGEKVSEKIKKDPEFSLLSEKIEKEIESIRDLQKYLISFLSDSSFLENAGTVLIKSENAVEETRLFLKMLEEIIYLRKDEKFLQSTRISSIIAEEFFKVLKKYIASYYPDVNRLIIAPIPADEYFSASPPAKLSSAGILLYPAYEGEAPALWTYLMICRSICYNFISGLLSTSESAKSFFQNTGISSEEGAFLVSNYILCLIIGPSYIKEMKRIFGRNISPRVYEICKRALEGQEEIESEDTAPFSTLNQKEYEENQKIIDSLLSFPIFSGVPLSSLPAGYAVFLDEELLNYSKAIFSEPSILTELKPLDILRVAILASDENREMAKYINSVFESLISGKISKKKKEKIGKEEEFAFLSSEDIVEAIILSSVFQRKIGYF